MAQRWRVVQSEAAAWRAAATVRKAQEREHEALQKPRLHVQAQRLQAPALAQEGWAVLATQWKDHASASSQVIEHTRYATNGRPTAKRPIKASEWQRQAQGTADVERIQQAKQDKACFVLGTNIEAEQLSCRALRTSERILENIAILDSNYGSWPLFVQTESRTDGKLAHAQRAEKVQ